MTVDGLRGRLQDDLRDAMKARDRTRVSVLRSTLGAIANAEAVPATDRPNVVGRDLPTEVERRVLTAADVSAVVMRELDELERDAELHRTRGDAEALADLEARIGILAVYVG
jgi:uncharacterized protein YqeY